ncbi:uncharacterized protein LOC110717698 [Chenopodium quinoa]|uniref:LRAT domain-containing protein n=1 Tax=Chenopodium quinoa TaxID=63459 RepID=A0A803KU09_CHEQI|nr:uncharacterized protein LOC110717698 [Chenopodium quinoa]XP_021752155.1 uncharacterized protein LOC110717698 [Chenopodium quinoa]
MGIFSNKISKEVLKPGDHIYSWRNAYLYSHHGIYAGEGKVIHFTRGPGQEIGTGTFLDNIVFSSSASSDRTKSPCPVCGDQSNLSGVISSCLDCFLWDGELYLFEYKVTPAFFLAKARGGTCTLAPSDPPEDVLSRASFLLENGFGGYNIFRNNCEHFAIYCKTGLLVVTDISVGRSGQATAFVAAVSAIVSSPLRFLTTSCSGLAAVGCGMYCVSRLVADIGVRRDVMKVAVERLVSRCDLVQSAETGTAKLELVNSCDVDLPAETETATLRLVSSCGLDLPGESAAAKQD